MKRGRKFIFLIVFCLLTVLLEFDCVFAKDSSNLQNWIVYEYDETNGLPTGEANTVLQTQDGYVWVGSYGGLIRYDGTSFRNYSKEGALLSSSIRALFEDSKGRLWIGTNDRGVYLYENNAFTHYEYENAQECLSVRCFTEDSKGNVYVGTTSGLVKADKNRLIFLDSDVYGMTIYSIAVDQNDVLWVCMDDGIAKLLDGDKVIHTFDSEKMEAPLYCAGRMNDGTLYLGTSENVIYRVEFLDGDYKSDSFSLHRYETGNASTINHIVQDEKGNIWVAALSGSGYLDTDHQWNPVAAKNVTAINMVAFDYEGNVWLASTSYGVIHLVNGIYCNANEAAGLSETSINAVEICRGFYYLGTDTGLVVLDRDFTPVENELTRLLQGDRIRDLLCDREGNLWIGTYYQNGLVLYEPEKGEITSFTQKDGLSNEQIRMVLECSNGKIAVATQSGITILKDHKVERTYTEKDGLSYPIILCLCEGGDGTLYAGSDGQGFYAIKDDVIKQYGFDEGLSAGVVLRMLPDDNGKGLFISAGNELFYWDFETFRLLDNYDKSPGSIFDMHINGGELWLMQSNGIHVLNRRTLLSGKETAVKIIGVSDGLTGTLNANNWNIKKGNIFYLCTSNGLSVLNLDKMETEPKRMLAAVNQVIVDDVVYESPERVDIDGKATRLTLQFVVLSYSGKEKTIRYRLEGFDEEDHIVTDLQPMSASYTNLSGGDYEFIMEILGADGESVTTACTVPIHKEYLLWEYAWFWVLIGIIAFLLLLCIIFISIRIKTLRYKQRQAEYQNIIEQALKTFANTIDAKDTYTNGHSVRVAVYALEIAKRLKLSGEEQERIYYIALMHDIGKIGIADEILNKPGKLTPEERKVIMSHPAIGGEILKDFSSLPGISEGARYHHERYDGKGYNEGLKGEEIPLFARIICVADSYDAMSSARCYRKSMDSDVIKKELRDNAGTQFDPEIVKVMLELITEGIVPVELDKSAALNSVS